MRKAAESAAKFLADKAKSNPKLNPVPYPFLRSIVNKQVEWARTQRGVTPSFPELLEAVRAELLKAGIYTMATDSKDSQPAIKDTADTGGAIPPQLIHFDSAGEAASVMIIFDWLHRVLMKAHADNYSELMLTASKTHEGEHHA
ncbi:MAG: hypothetical protein IJU48_10010 [Synergistaceae bacterium]|nr:hypothetical protein [Synergistaceae bacterium]